MVEMVQMDVQGDGDEMGKIGQFLWMVLRLIWNYREEMAGMGMMENGVRMEIVPDSRERLIMT
jgi:hypothetical protein